MEFVMQKATLTFENRHDAVEFATQWARFTFTGHIISGNIVEVYDVDEAKKEWIDNYASSYNAGGEKPNERLEKLL